VRGMPPRTFSPFDSGSSLLYSTRFPSAEYCPTQIRSCHTTRRDHLPFERGSWHRKALRVQAGHRLCVQRPPFSCPSPNLLCCPKSSPRPSTIPFTMPGPQTQLAPLFPTPRRPLTLLTTLSQDICLRLDSSFAKTPYTIIQGNDYAPPAPPPPSPVNFPSESWSTALREEGC